jgi:Phage integrase family
MGSMLLDAAGHRRSPATMPGYHRGQPPRNKGEQYPADPPTVEEIVSVMRTIGEGADGHRLRALILLLWRAGLRISEALALQESDLDRSRGAVLVRRGKGGKRREVGMDRWAWEQLDPWLEIRRELPVGAVLCVIHGPTAGRRWEASAARKQLHHAAGAAGVRRRFAPHQLRHAHAVEMAHEGVPLVVIQRQLARPRQPRDHQRLPAGHRQQRDYRRRSRTTVTDDLSHRRAPDEAIVKCGRVGQAQPTGPTAYPRLARSKDRPFRGSRPAFDAAAEQSGPLRGRHPSRCRLPLRPRGAAWPPSESRIGNVYRDV